MGYANAKSVDANLIPVIDISPLRDGSDPLGVAKALHEASQGLGFIYIKGHGIPCAVIEAARNSAFDFFRAAQPEKSTVTVSASHRGWLAQGGARMQDNASTDLKESFIWGYQNANGESPADHPLRGPNQWPACVPDMSLHAMAWFHQAQTVAHHLMRAFALGLGLPDSFFLRQCDKPLSRASYVWYPAQLDNTDSHRFGVGPHTDFGVLTVLCQDAVGGLQVEDANGQWLHAPPIEGTLVVNVADLLSRWTGGAYKSTPHRVINSSGKERLSLVLAFDPNPETIIDARDVHGDKHVSEHAPITCGDYLVWRFEKAFNYRHAGSGSAA